jgi:hypothetical protein
MHVELDPTYREAADLLDRFRAELASRREQHTALVLQLSSGIIDAPASRTAAEAAQMLIDGVVPSTTSDKLGAMQAEELSLREQIAAMTPVEARLAERAELARVRAREQALRDDPATVEVSKAWAAAEAAARRAVELERKQERALIAGAFGNPEFPRPLWINPWALL